MFSICGCPKTQASFGTIWVDTPVPLAVETTQGGSPMRKTPKNTPDVKIFKKYFFVLDFVHKTMLTKYKVLTPVQLRYLEGQKPASPLNIVLGLDTLREWI